MSFVLADTSVWVNHFRRTNRRLHTLLAGDQIVCHPLIVIELACGTPPAPRVRTLADLQRLRCGVVATTSEILELVEAHELFDSGCGAVDIAWLASALLTNDTLLWTLDKNLDALARRLGVSYSPISP